MPVTCSLLRNPNKHIVANHTTTPNPTAPLTLPVLYADDYGWLSFSPRGTFELMQHRFWQRNIHLAWRVFWLSHWSGSKRDWWVCIVRSPIVPRYITPLTILPAAGVPGSMAPSLAPSSAMLTLRAPICLCRSRTPPYRRQAATFS